MLAAHNTSSTSLYLEWSPPSLASVHGELLGYLLSYRPRDTSPSQAQEVKITKPGAQVTIGRIARTMLDLCIFSYTGMVLTIPNIDGKDKAIESIKEIPFQTL